jgi:hypothetical protein
MPQGFPDVARREVRGAQKGVIRNDETNWSRFGGPHRVRWCIRFRNRVGNSANDNRTIGYDAYHAGHFTDDSSDDAPYVPASQRERAGVLAAVVMLRGLDHVQPRDRVRAALALRRSADRTGFDIVDACLVHDRATSAILTPCKSSKREKVMSGSRRRRVVARCTSFR